MDPRIWGPPAWTFLHSVTLAYPDNPTETDRTNYGKFFNNLQPVLPCLKCSNNYLTHIKEDPVENNLKDKESLVKWLIEMHNKVNRLYDKPEVTYDEMLDNYKKLYNVSSNSMFDKNITNYSKSNTNINTILLFLFVVSVLFLIGIYVKKYLNK
tara:strand:+ start:25 stop:486 length:462 start_codon:yes stop_codon:yes gene_type:complete